MNKEREIAIVEAVRKQLRGIPGGHLMPHEAPDVLLAHENGVSGFEVTNLYPAQIDDSMSPQAQESERRTIVDRARVKAELTGLPALLVAVHFSDASKLQKSDREPLAQTISDLVRQHCPNEFGVKQLKYHHAGDVRLPRQLHSINIHRQPGITRHSWSVPESAIIQEEFSPVIQASIDKKSAEIARYLTSCDDCSLVIASGVESFLPAYEASGETLAHVYQSPFMRTFYVEAFGNRVFELSTIRREPHGTA